MSRLDNSPWINEGPLRVRFREEQGDLIKETNQPDRNLIMDSIQNERRDGTKQSFLGGHKVASIPLVDWERVIKKYPELMLAGEKEEKTKALIRFSNDPEMAQYKIRRA